MAAGLLCANYNKKMHHLLLATTWPIGLLCVNYNKNASFT